MIEPLEPLAITVKDAVVVTGLGKTTLFELLKSGEIEGVKIGNRRLITYSSLKALIERNKTREAA